MKRKDKSEGWKCVQNITIIKEVGTRAMEAKTLTSKAYFPTCHNARLQLSQVIRVGLKLKGCLMKA
jgi:hypothetical protein